MTLQPALAPVLALRCSPRKGSCHEPVVALAVSSPLWLPCCTTHAEAYRREGYQVTKTEDMVPV